MNEFNPTHVIRNGFFSPILVLKHELEDCNYKTGAKIFALYTEQEWENYENASWIYDEEAGLQFNGIILHPRCDGSTIEKLF
jgi:hypothetical protein